MYQKIGILMLASVFYLQQCWSPSFTVANAQGNATQGNQTIAKGLSIDVWIKILKENNPDLNDLEQDSKVNDIIWKDQGNARSKASP